MHEDFGDLLASFVKHNVRFLVVGAHALAVHGVPRATGDLDVWIDANKENARRVWKALADFGAPLDSLDVTESDFVRPDRVVQFGLPPRRIDILTSVSGIDFATAWEDRVEQEVGGELVPVLGRASLVRNKRATGRPKDLGDLESLGEI